jgi:hypothetical protein
MGHCRSSIVDPKPSRRRSGTPVLHCVGVLSVKRARQACPSDSPFRGPCLSGLPNPVGLSISLPRARQACPSDSPFRGPCLSGLPNPVGLSISLPRARRARPSDFRRDRVVRFVPRCDALIASDAQRLIIHPTSPGTTTLCVSHHLHICRPHFHTLTSNLIIPYLIFAFHDFDRSLLIRLKICPPRNFHPRTNQEATHSFSPVLPFVIMAKRLTRYFGFLTCF